MTFLNPADERLPIAMNSPNDRHQKTAVTEEKITAFLSSKAAFPGASGPVKTIETHAARIYLCDTMALKAKKHIRLPFLDFSTLETRRQALTRELELNRPHAPEIYIDVVPIPQAPDGALSIGGPGPAVDWALRMHRFDESALLSEHVRRGPLASPLCKAVAAMIAHYHRTAPAAQGASIASTTGQTLAALLSNLETTAQEDDAPALTRLRKSTQASLAAVQPLLAARATAGAVRRCHGDLHLGNIVLIDGKPIPFDALEFDESLATTDVLYDLAFLLMDLEASGDRNAASLVLNAYVSISPLGHELEGLAALPLFLSMRAAVRALVAFTRADQQDGPPRQASRDKGRKLLALSENFLETSPPRLVAVGGFSGTGKSTLAAALAQEITRPPGALHLRSDIERKHLFGVEETERLSPAHYTQEVSEEVYRLLFNKAERALHAGHSVIVDAVFTKLEERTAVEAAAHRANAAFHGLWLQAPADVLLSRVAARHGDASDADVAVVNAQLAKKLGTLSWDRVDARSTCAATLKNAMTALTAGPIIGKQ
jgi:uncharacterized protein